MTDQTVNDVTTNGPATPEKRERKERASGPHVYRAINAVKLRLDKFGGITKDRQADFGDRYQFRGIDDMYNTLCRITAEEGLVMIPRVTGKQIDREAGRKGGLQTHVYLDVEVEFASSIDGSKALSSFVGEAIDTSDKASNKAISAAMKYACVTVFQIPTHGESDDTENYDHPVGHQAGAEPPSSEEAPPPRTRKQAEPKTPEKLMGTISTAETFLELLTLFNSEPKTKDVADRITARAMTLIQQAPFIHALQEAKGLVAALGQPKALMDCYNGRYMALRQIQGEGAS